MNDLAPPLPTGMFVVQDIERGLYLGGLAHAKNDPTVGRATWTPDLAKALPLPYSEVHKVRAVAITLKEEQGGRPEEFVRAVPAPVETKPDVMVALYNYRVKGWYQRHQLAGDSMHVSWTNLATLATPLPRSLAETIVTREGLPPSAIQDKPITGPLEEAFQRDQQAGMVPSLREHQSQDRQARKPAIAQDKREYDVIAREAVTVLRDDVQKRLEEGWDLVGAMVPFLAGPGQIVFYQSMTRVTYVV